jgi:hypothetical protein
MQKQLKRPSTLPLSFRAVLSSNPVSVPRRKYAKYSICKTPSLPCQFDLSSKKLSVNTRWAADKSFQSLKGGAKHEIFEH